MDEFLRVNESDSVGCLFDQNPNSNLKTNKTKSSNNSSNNDDNDSDNNCVDEEQNDFRRSPSPATPPTGRTKDDVIWIMKPASRTNRGFGIKVVQGMDAVLAMVNRASSRDSTRARSNKAKANPSSPHKRSKSAPPLPRAR
jgi:hypothetical protein